MTAESFESQTRMLHEQIRALYRRTDLTEEERHSIEQQLVDSFNDAPHTCRECCYCNIMEDCDGEYYCCDIRERIPSYEIDEENECDCWGSITNVLHHLHRKGKRQGRYNILPWPKIQNTIKHTHTHSL